jgi:ketosteroid isomerase-like protein
MSHENVEFVERAYEVFNRVALDEREVPRMIELFAPAAQIDMSRRVFNPEIYEGHAGVRRFIGEVREVWKEWVLMPERLIDAGDSVVVIETIRGRARSSGVQVETPRTALVLTVGRGKIIRMTAYYDPQEALQDVGLKQ